MNDTHDSTRTSWVASANGATDFPIQNLPLGVYRPRGETRARVGIAIGDQILDVTAALREGHYEGLGAAAAEACAGTTLNPLMALEPSHWSALRRQTSALLASDATRYRTDRDRMLGLLTPMDAAELGLPARIGDYTDFYASIHHATNVGSMFRPDNPLLPNYKYVPIGYHGRASSIVVSGTAVRRPSGQIKDPQADAPVFAPSRSLDYEMELGCYVGGGNTLGTTIPIDRAEAHLFGVSLLNDWSARDVQSWEYQPLGPFLAKNFATSVSPWVVTLEALEPFRVPAFSRPAGDPAPLGYLDTPENRVRGGLDITVEVYLASAKMRERGTAPTLVSRGRASNLYWTMAQLLAHHASNGCNLSAGDLLGSGTISGSDRGSRGCLLELTWRGSEPFSLPNGEVRRFLEDGDEVVMRGYGERAGFARIGLGECRGVVLGVESLA